MNDEKYWHAYWTTNPKLDDDRHQKKIGRTAFGREISPLNWSKTCHRILEQLTPDDTSHLLDLCCGNGLLSEFLNPFVNKITAVDYSKKLLDNFVINDPKITKVLCNVLDFDFSIYRADRILMYFSAQHFSETSMLHILKKASANMTTGAIFLIGDIPDIDRKWNFYSTTEFRHFYFSGLEKGTPSIGTWYQKAYFQFAAEYCGFSSVQIQDQPNYMINSKYRFDVILQK